MNQLFSQSRKSVELTVCRAGLEEDVLPFDVAEVMERRRNRRRPSPKFEPTLPRNTSSPILIALLGCCALRGKPRVNSIAAIAN
jgi:hypothetical protein